MPAARVAPVVTLAALAGQAPSRRLAGAAG